MIHPSHLAILAAIESTGRFDSPLQMSVIDGGEVNNSFTLLSAGERFYLKQFDLDVLLPAQRRQQYKIQQQIAEQKMAVMPLYYNGQLGIQVEPWIEERPLTQLDHSEDEKIAFVAEAISRIHTLDIDAAALDLPDIWQRYLLLADITPDLPMMQRIKSAEKVWSEQSAADMVFCHNDLSYGHVIPKPDYTILDWEYAAVGNRYFDLMSCASINNMDELQTKRLIELYCQQLGLDTGEAHKRANEQLQLVELTADLWQQAVLVANQTL